MNHVILLLQSSPSPPLSFKVCCDSLEILTDFFIREFSLSFGRKLWQISCLGMSTQANTAAYPKQAFFVQSTEDENVSLSPKWKSEKDATNKLQQEHT